jgi:hypothetical protein
MVISTVSVQPKSFFRRYKISLFFLIKLAMSNLCVPGALIWVYVSSEPGWMVISTVAKFNKKRQFPLMIVNNTNKTIRLKKNCIVASANKIERVNLVSNNMHRWDEKVDKSCTKAGIIFYFYRAYIYNLRFWYCIFCTTNYRCYFNIFF